MGGHAVRDKQGQPNRSGNTPLLRLNATGHNQDLHHLWPLEVVLDAQGSRIVDAMRAMHLS